MPSRTQSILIGGLVVGILSTSVLGFINVLCCAGVIIGAMVGVWHYTEEHQLTIEASQGAIIGALAGIVGAIIAGILNQLLIFIGLDFMSGWREIMMQQFGGGMGSEEMPEFNPGQMGAMVMLLGMVFNIVLYAIFGAIGGAIGASVFQKGNGMPGSGTPGTEPTGGAPTRETP